MLILDQIDIIYIMSFEKSNAGKKSYQYSENNLFRTQTLPNKKMPINYEYPQNKGIKNQQSSGRSDIEVLVRMKEGDELEASFIQFFTKYVINFQDPGLQKYCQQYAQVEFSQFYSFLKTQHQKYTQDNYWLGSKSQYRFPMQRPISRIKSTQNVRKGSFDKKITTTEKPIYQFSFEANNNSLILLLDLSPYMLIYDSSTKSFPLKNMQQIIKNLLQGIHWHYQQRKLQKFDTKYKISAYGFSTNNQLMLQFLKDQQLIIKDNNQGYCNKQKIQNYISLCISRCKYPYIETKLKIPISQFIQNTVNYQQGNPGIQAIITISTFQEFDIDTRIIFSSNWYTFAFICTGQLNFATYTIQGAEIIDRFPTNPRFKTKFIYKCQFLENWEKIQMIEKKMIRTKYLTTATNKYRTILFNSQGEIKQTIFNDVLKFKIDVESIKKRKLDVSRYNQVSPISCVQEKYKPKHVQSFDIPEQNIAEILKAKYLQGWQYLTQEGYYENSLMEFRLNLGNRRWIVYNAKKNGPLFNISISQVDYIGQNTPINEDITKQKLELMQSIKKIDLINTSNFDIIKNKDSKKQRSFFNLDSRGHEGLNLLNFIFDHHQLWNRYFRVKTIYVRLRPNFNIAIFGDFLSEILNFLGDKISNLCFVNRKQQKILSIQNKQSVKWKIIFTKISCQLNFLSLKFAFLKYRQIEIKTFINNFLTKLNFLKLNHSILDIVPEDLFKFCQNKFNIQATGIFKKSWKIGFPQQKIIYKMYKSYNANIIKKLGYQLMKSKICNFYYYKILKFITNNNTSKEKVIFLHLKIDDNERILVFQMSVYPDLCLITKLPQNYKSQILNEKGVICFTELFELVIQQLKDIQKKVGNLIKNYAQIYQNLCKTNNQIQKKNQSSKVAIRKSANRVSPQQSINIDQIPGPENFLMNSEITSIKGDLIIHSLKHPEKYYAFFNINDVMLIYLYLKNKQIYYRCISIKYLGHNDSIQQQSDSTEKVDNNFYDLELEKSQIKKIMQTIGKQQREQKYKRFYEAVAKSQNIQKMSQYEQNLKDFYQPKLDFTEIVTIIRKTQYSHVSHRFAAILSQFHRLFFQLIEIFFNKGQNHSYFSQKKEPKLPDEYEKIKNQQWTSFNNIILKIQLGQNKIESLQDLSYRNFINLFLQSSNSAYIGLKFYGFTISFEKIDCIAEYIKKIMRQCVIFLTLATVTQDNGIMSLQQTIKNQSYTTMVHKKIKLPQQLNASYPDFVRYIQLLTTNSFLDFHIINDDFETDKKQNIDLTLSRKTIQKKAQFIANEQQYTTLKPGQKINASFKLCLKYWILLQINKNQNIITIDYLNFQYMTLSTSINKCSYIKTICTETENYIKQIVKAVKIHNTFKNIQKYLSFPAQNFVPIYLNEINFQKMQNKKKKQSKYHVPKPKKYRTKKSDSIKQGQQSFIAQNKVVPDADTFYLKLIYEESIEFYAKFKSGEILQNLAHSEKLNSSLVRNLENTYIFLNQEIRQYFFFYLEQIKTCETPKIKSSFRCQDNHQKNILKYSVYCIDQCFKKSEKYLSHAILIKKAVQEVTFNLIATDINLRLPPCILDFQQQEYFKSGEKWSLTINLPYINEKSNFRQYLKQHLETQFTHKRTQFRSQVRKRQFPKQNKESFAGSTKSSMGSTLLSNCQHEHHSQIITGENKNFSSDKKCSPSMWIFNTLKERQMHVKFGMCIYLIKIDLNYSHSLAGNCDIWKRIIKNNTAKSYIYPAYQNNCQNTAQDNLLGAVQGHESNNTQWHQCRNILNYLQKWSDNNENQWILDRSNKQYKQESENSIFHPPDQNITTTITFNILSYFGSPKFNKLEKTYKDFVFCALYDYWIQNYLFSSIATMAYKSEYDFKANSINQIKSKLSFMQQQKSIQVNSPIMKRVQSSPQKFCLPGLIDPLQTSKIKNCYQLLIKTRSLAQSCASSSNIIDLSKSSRTFDQSDKKYHKISPCHYLYSTYSKHKLLIEQKFQFLHKIIENFVKLLERVTKKYILPLVIYGRVKEQYIIWEIQYCPKSDNHVKEIRSYSMSVPQKQPTNLSNLSFHSNNSVSKTNETTSYDQSSFYTCLERIQNYFTANQIQPDKIGLLFTDSLIDIHNMRIHKGTDHSDNLRKQKDKKQTLFCERDYFLSQLYNSQEISIEFDTLKYFNENQSFCQNQYFFKRSLLVNFQCSNDGFCFFTYNFNQQLRQFKQLKRYLYLMQGWFFQKNRLLQFIISAKNNKKDDNDNFIIPPKMKTDHELLNQLKKQFIELRTIGVNEKQINSEMLSKLIIQLTFKKIPSQFFFRFKDCLDYIYQLLMIKTKLYANRPEYKGKQKSQLQKLGKQFLSILRMETIQSTLKQKNQSNSQQIKVKQ